VRRVSLLGEHPALWFVPGGGGFAVDRSRRPRWRRAVVAVVTAYVANTALLRRGAIPSTGHALPRGALSTPDPLLRRPGWAR
jgi:hypothetical protein